MKKQLIVFVIFIILLGCNRGKSNSKAGEEVEPYRQVGVENVNGNIPDTTNTIDLSTKKVDPPDKSDSSPKP